MHILLIVRWPVGGIRTFLRYVYGDWQGDVEFTFVVPKLDEVSVLKEDLAEIKCNWIELAYTPSVLSFATAARDLLNNNSIDIVHAHGFTSAVAVSLASIFKTTKKIVTSHDVLLRGQFIGWKGLIKKIAMSIVLNRFDVIHSVSLDAQNNLIEMLPAVKNEKCRVILNGIDSERFYKAEPLNIKKEIGIPSDAYVIGFFGRFMAQKGFGYLVSAVDSIRREGLYSIKVVCFGTGGFIREEMEVIQKKGLDDIFIFKPFTPNVSASMKGCDIIVMPSLWEACGLLAMEALVAGVPLVASRCIGLREVCKNSPAIMVEPANSNSLEDGIKKALVMPRKVFTDFQSVAACRYDISVTRKTLSELYQNL